MAIAAVAAAVARPSSASAVLLTRPRPTWPFFSPLASSSFSSSTSASLSSSTTRKLILYSKPGCCLCDGLKEKLHAAFLLSGPDSLHDVYLQVRDITTNPDWERAYQYEIPVLAKLLPDGTEDRNDGRRIHLSFALVFVPIDETIPRLSPRIGVELVQKKIAAALRE